MMMAEPGSPDPPAPTRKRAQPHGVEKVAREGLGRVAVTVAIKPADAHGYARVRSLQAGYRADSAVAVAREHGLCPRTWFRSAGSGSPGRGGAACQTARGGRLTGGVSLKGASVSRLM